jgi:hypothetical protein
MRMRKQVVIAAFLAWSGAAWSGAGAAEPARVPPDMARMAPMTDAELSKHVGEWLYDGDGMIVGSFERLRGKDEAVVHVSRFFSPGNRFVVVPDRDLGVAGGRVVLRHGTLASLEMLPETR